MPYLRKSWKDASIGSLVFAVVLVLMVGVTDLSAAAAMQGDPGRGFFKRQLLKRSPENSDENVAAMLAGQTLANGDEIWLVSTRSASNRPADPNMLSWSRLIGGCLQTRTFADFQLAHESDPTVQTVVYAHGNRTDANWAILGGLKLYGNIFQNRLSSSRMRYVIWSWPSEREISPIGKDADLKSRRAVNEGVTLRSTLDQLGGRRPMLIGYSFGGQLVVSALQSPATCSSGQPFCVTLISPGFNRDFIHQEINHDALAMNTHQMQAFVNAKDKVIWANNKNYCRRKYCGSGLCDYRVSTKLNQASYLTEIDLTSENSGKHSIDLYSQNPRIVSGVLCQLEQCLGESETWIPSQPLSIEEFEGFGGSQHSEEFENFQPSDMLFQSETNIEATPVFITE